MPQQELQQIAGSVNNDVKVGWIPILCVGLNCGPAETQRVPAVVGGPSSGEQQMSTRKRVRKGSPARPGTPPPGRFEAAPPALGGGISSPPRGGFKTKAGGARRQRRGPPD